MSNALGFLVTGRKFTRRFVLLVGLLACCRVSPERVRRTLGLLPDKEEGWLRLHQLRQLRIFRNKSEQVLLNNLKHDLVMPEPGGRNGGWIEIEPASHGPVEERGLRLRLRRDQIRIDAPALDGLIAQLKSEIVPVTPPASSIVPPPASSIAPPPASSIAPPPASSIASPPRPGQPYRADAYVERPFEQEAALGCLRSAGEPLVLQAPAGYGKRTFMGWLREQAPRRRAAPALLSLSFSLFEKSALDDFGHLLAVLGEQLARRAERPAIVDEAEGRPGSPTDRFLWLLERLQLHLTPEGGPLLLCFERVDRLWGCPPQADFFCLLRGLVDEPADPPWDGLRLAVTVAMPSILLDTTDHSGFFARAVAVQIGDFSDPQLKRLADLCTASCSPEDLTAVREWVGAHPKLAHLVFAASSPGRPPRALLADVTARALLFRDHLLELHQGLAARPELLRSLALIVRDPQTRIPPDHYGRLYAKGLLCERDGGLYLRCRLYEEYFGPLLRGAPS